MPSKSDERFEKILRLVRDGIYQRFRRDPIVVQAQGTTIHIEHPSEVGAFLTRDSSSAELAQFKPEILAEGLLMVYGSEKKRGDLIAYAKAQFPDADEVRLLDDDFDVEAVVVELKFHGVRVRAGLTKPLWDHTESFDQLREHMERHRWKEAVNSASNKKALLGENGWVEWK